ncbi:MAG TPA: peroxiredoxin [Acidobacteriota bacterium]|nr:peroxiredoxin [Acidobacteriota bacterium]
MAALTVGTKAPDFTLPDKDGKLHSLKNIKSKYTVVYFYPKDNTTGCTLEARDFSVMKQQFESRGITIIGISGGDAASKTKFCTQNELTITLLSDTDYSTSKAFGVYGEKSFMGKIGLGIQRSTFVLDEQKKIVAVFENVNALGHAKNVLAKIAGLSSIR